MGAEELVHFEGAAVKPTPFQERIAQQNGQSLQAMHGTPLAFSQKAGGPPTRQLNSC